VTKIVLNAHTKSDARAWSLEIVNKADEVVRRFGGQGQAPAHVQWDGKDETGLPLPDGVYRYRLKVSDRDGRELAGAVRTVEIFTTGPQGQVPVVQSQEAPEEPR
jgi:flagellar hook assembly protein FlgD